MYFTSTVRAAGEPFSASFSFWAVTSADALGHMAVGVDGGIEIRHALDTG